MDATLKGLLRYGGIGLIYATLIGLSGCMPQEQSTSIDYNADIRPILSDKCFTCHGPDNNKREAGLRLDDASYAYAELEESPGKYAVVPGNPSKSEIITRIHHEDPEERMPPADAKLALTSGEKDLLEGWIEQGAVYKPLWSLIPPAPVEAPTTQTGEAVNNEIDSFVLDALQNADLSFSQKASKETLIRRAYFDLIGLPPALDVIDAFLEDDSPEAFEKVVDNLLDSPAYGERMASMWMDVARYADSDGYLDDKHRDFSPWRDWVIQAFNDNLPYDDFVTWQLAGDLLPNATQDQILATAFNRLHKKNSEAGIVFEEFRSEYVADRTNTFGKAFLGLTLECARCHDHKYDPISQRDYYQIYSFFNSTDEIGHAVYGPGQTPGPSLLLTSSEDDVVIDRLERTINRISKRLDAASQKSEPEFQKWLSGPISSSEIGRQIDANQTAHYAFDAILTGRNDQKRSLNALDHRTPAILKDPVLEPGIKGLALRIEDYNHAALGEQIGWYERTDPFTIDLWIYPDTLYTEAMLFTHSEEWRLGLRGYNLHLENNRLVFRMAHSYPQNALEVTTTQAIPGKNWTGVTITYDGSSKAAGIRIYLNGEQADVKIQRDNLYRSILFTPDIHTYGFKGIELGQRDKFTPFKKGLIDAFSVYNSALTPLEVLYLHDPERVKNLIQAPAQRAASADLFRAYYLAHNNPESIAYSEQLKTVKDSLNARLTQVQEIMVMGDLPSPRPTYVLNRGLYDAPADEVKPGTPSAILPFAPNLPPNRLGLARWLFQENNPLTARVMVNRIWQMHFGNALVSTMDDFGNQGATPTHPELLDWMANDFRSSGWDLKQLHKRIMMSRVYQQSSVITPDLLERDPDNTLLARGPSFRLPAEMIRDNALAISGLLTAKIGGPSVYPYQPEGLWDELSTKGWRYRYLQESGEGLYRRSLYTTWKRTAPPPSMLLFDAPDRSFCTVDRQPTSTPLQALVLLNDPQFVEAARVLAEGLLHTHEGTGALKSLFRLVTGRHPTEAELKLLSEFHQAELATFQADPDKAISFLATGASLADASLDPIQVAAMAVVANSLMNTDEGFVRR